MATTRGILGCLCSSDTFQEREMVRDVLIYHRTGRRTAPSYARAFELTVRRRGVNLQVTAGDVTKHVIDHRRSRITRGVNANVIEVRTIAIRKISGRSVG